jgi:DNA-binding IclR family transcriptional regulator
MKRQSSVSVKSTTRTLDILELVASSNVAPTFGTLRALLRIPSSSLYYLLHTLIQRGYLIQSGERGGYRIGDAIGSLSRRSSHCPSWQALIAPILQRLTEALGEASHYAECRSQEIECVLTKLGTQPLVRVLRPGQRAPLYAFSGGRIFLADMPDDAIDNFLRRVQFRRYTPHTICDRKMLLHQVQQVRHSGFAYSRDELTLGITGISVGLRHGGHLVGTVGVAIPSERLSRKVEIAACKQLGAAVESFSHLL